MCGLAAQQGNLIFTLTVTELPRDWMGVKASSRFEQISAVIFVCLRGVTADGCHSFTVIAKHTIGCDEGLPFL